MIYLCFQDGFLPGEERHPGQMGCGHKAHVSQPALLDRSQAVLPSNPGEGLWSSMPDLWEAVGAPPVSGHSASAGGTALRRGTWAIWGFSFKEITLKGPAVSCLVRYSHFIYLKSDLFLSTPTLVGSDKHPDFLLTEE